MTDVPVKVTAFSLAEKDLRSGNKRLGFFDCEFGYVRLLGCAIHRTRQGGFVAYPPRLDDRTGARLSIHITDSAIRHAMMQAARQAYIALGGEHGEWTRFEDRAKREGDEAWSAEAQIG